MSESQFNKYEQEVKRLENELNLVESAIPTQQASEKYVECSLCARTSPSPPNTRLPARPKFHLPAPACVRSNLMARASAYV